MDPDDFKALLCRFGFLEEVAELGTLPGAVARQLGMGPVGCGVWLHPNTAYHIYVQRGFTDGEAQFVFSCLMAAILAPHFAGCDPRAPLRYGLVRMCAETGRGVFVAIKLVPASASPHGRDEIWVSTAHPLPANFLARKRYRDTLAAVAGLDDSVRGD